MTFQESLADHLGAIAARDIDRFAATVSHDPHVRVVGPDGGSLVGYEAILDAHRGWFTSPVPWTFSPTVVLTKESDCLGFALLNVDYREGDDARRFLLSLLFCADEGTWRLFYDQNTPLAGSAATVR